MIWASKAKAISVILGDSGSSSISFSVLEALLPDLAELEPFEQVILADDAEGGGLGCRAGRLHGPQQPLELVADLERHP